MPPSAENGTLAGKVALVTGGASGIGRAIAVAFARHGARVVVADIDQPGSQDTVRKIEELGGRAIAVACDVTRSADVQDALAQTAQAFGGLDYAFNNAGAEQQPKPTADITEEEWDRIIAINLRSLFVSMKYEIPLMLRTRRRRDRQQLLRRGDQSLRPWRRVRRRRNTTSSARPKTPPRLCDANIRINAICPGSSTPR